MPREICSSVVFAELGFFGAFKVLLINCPKIENKIDQGQSQNRKSKQSKKVDDIFWLFSLNTLYFRDVLSDTSNLAGSHFNV